MDPLITIYHKLISVALWKENEQPRQELRNKSKVTVKIFFTATQCGSDLNWLLCNGQHGDLDTPQLHHQQIAVRHGQLV